MELSKDNCHRNRNGNKIINMSIDDKHTEEWLNRIHNDDDFVRCRNIQKSVILAKILKIHTYKDTSLYNKC